MQQHEDPTTHEVLPVLLFSNLLLLVTFTCREQSLYVLQMPANASSCLPITWSVLSAVVAHLHRCERE